MSEITTPKDRAAKKSFTDGKLKQEFRRNIQSFGNAVLADLWYDFEQDKLSRHEKFQLLEYCAKFGFPQEKTNLSDPTPILKRLLSAKEQDQPKPNQDTI